MGCRFLLAITYIARSIFIFLNDILWRWGCYGNKLHTPKCIKYNLIKPNNEIDMLLLKTHVNHARQGYVEIGEGKFVMPSRYLAIADDIENIEVKDSDVWVISHPKSGTTWTQEMVRLIMNGVDFKDAKENIWDKFIHLELEGIFNVPFADYMRGIAKNTLFSKIFGGFAPSVLRAQYETRTPRLFKSHLHWDILPKMLRERKTKAKIVYITRNPKDACTSYFYHVKAVDNFLGSYDEFCRLFLAGRVYYGPYWESVLPYLKHRDDPYICFIKYEDMKKDLASVVRKVSKFLGKEISKEKMEALINHLRFENMKNNASCNMEKPFQFAKLTINAKQNGNFMRSGRIGSYKEDMNPEIEKEFDKWIEKNKKGIDYEF